MAHYERQMMVRVRVPNSDGAPAAPPALLPDGTHNTPPKVPAADCIFDRVYARFESARYIHSFLSNKKAVWILFEVAVDDYDATLKREAEAAKNQKKEEATSLARAAFAKARNEGLELEAAGKAKLADADRLRAEATAHEPKGKKAQ